MVNDHNEMPDEMEIYLRIMDSVYICTTNLNRREQSTSSVMDYNWWRYCNARHEVMHIVHICDCII